MRIVNLENNNRKIISTINNFHVLEYVQDASVSPMNAIDEYFMSKMNVRRRQVVIDISRDHSAVIQVKKKLKTTKQKTRLPIRVESGLITRF